MKYIVLTKEEQEKLSKIVDLLSNEKDIATVQLCFIIQLMYKKSISEFIEILCNYEYQPLKLKNE